MGHRMYSRQSNGRFRRATLENMFGLHACICPDPGCRRINSHAVSEPHPETCHECGAPMKPETAPKTEEPHA
jgi:hypothetical protein